MRGKVRSQFATTWRDVEGSQSVTASHEALLHRQPLILPGRNTAFDPLRTRRGEHEVRW